MRQRGSGASAVLVRRVAPVRSRSAGGPSLARWAGIGRTLAGASGWYRTDPRWRVGLVLDGLSLARWGWYRTDPRWRVGLVSDGTLAGAF